MTPPPSIIVPGNTVSVSRTGILVKLFRTLFTIWAFMLSVRTDDAALRPESSERRPAWCRPPDEKPGLCLCACQRRDRYRNLIGLRPRERYSGYRARQDDDNAGIQCRPEAIHEESRSGD
jgi:hypothetical protein